MHIQQWIADDEKRWHIAWSLLRHLIWKKTSHNPLNLPNRGPEHTWQGIVIGTAGYVHGHEKRRRDIDDCFGVLSPQEWACCQLLFQYDTRRHNLQPDQGRRCQSFC